MSPEDKTPDPSVVPEPAAGEPSATAAELALEEALSGEPVTEDGLPVEPLAEQTAAEEPAAVAAEESAAAVPAASEPAADEEPLAGEKPAADESAAEAAEAAEAAAESGTAPLEDSVTEETSADVAADTSVGAVDTVTEDTSADEAAGVTEAAPRAGAPDDPESDLVAAGDVDSMPDLTSDEALEAALEALLLIVDSPASEELLADTLGEPRARIVVALRTMAQKFTDRTSGIDLRRVGEGWRFYTRDVHAPFVEKLLLDGQRSKLTRAALESLAVIAYRQPVTRSRVAAVRGVNVDGVIRTLLARGLIEEMGTDPETTGTLYVTTELFLERLGLSSLNDLPAIAPLLPEVDTIDDIQ